MSGFLGSGLGFWEIVAAIVVVAAAFIAVKITFSFDINKFIERRDKNNVTKLKNACPHFSLVMLGDNMIEVRSLYYKPAGTLHHFCRQCWLENPLDIEQHERDANYYFKNPLKLVDAQKKFTKLAKRAGKIV